MKPTTRYDLAATAALLAACLSATAQDAAQEIDTLEPMTVVGSAEAVWTLAGAAAYVDAEEFRERGYTNLGQILAKVPGVYVREEDGFGNFPNVSLRGADGTRSEKVTVMEDGILTAPSPYSATMPRASRRWAKRKPTPSGSARPSARR